MLKNNLKLLTNLIENLNQYIHVISTYNIQYDICT